MSRRLRILFVIFCGVSAMLIAALAGVYFALRYEPKFYRDALAVATDVQEPAGEEMLHNLAALASDLKKTGKWQARFTERQINGWLATDFVKNHPNALPPFFRDPRVCIEPDRIVIACRCELWIVSSVLTLSIASYVPEENMLALRIAKARAGMLPLPLGRVLDEISKAAQQSDYRLEWRQTGGDPVALLKIPPPENTGDPAVKIITVQLGKGEIIVSGSTEVKK